MVAGRAPRLEACEQEPAKGLSLSAQASAAACPPVIGLEATWHAFVTNYGRTAPVAPQVVFGDAEVGYASARGSIQGTSDAGVHWMGVRTPGT